MLRVLTPLLAVLAAAGPALAQESPWVETKFHRVHLRNGNFIDGKLIGVREHDVELLMPIGDMIIRKDTIDRIELMKIRSLNEKPKLDPPLKKAPAASETAKRVRPVWKPNVLPMLDDAIRRNLEAIFARFNIATREQRAELIKDMARQENAAPYLAARLPSLDEDLGLAVRDALLLMKDPDANPYLVSALECDRVFARMQAIDLLGELGKPENCDALRRCLRDEVIMVRVAAMSALTRLSDPDTLEKLVELFLDENAEIRSAALSHALNLGRKVRQVETVQEGLRRALLDARGAVAGELSWAAARTGKKELWAPIASHLQDMDPAVRGAVVEALGSLGAAESVPAVMNQFMVEDDKGVMLRLAATAWKLKSLDTVPLLIEWLRKNDPEIATAASRALFGLTRQGFGSSYDKWFDWWESVRPR